MDTRTKPSLAEARLLRWALLFLPGAVAAVLPWQAGADNSSQQKQVAGTAIDFSRQIRPILSENCFRCHGPDEKERKAKLRLDDGAAALQHGGVIVPRKSAESELLA